MMNRFFPANFPNKQYQLLFTQGSGESKEEIVNYEFDTKDLVCLALSSVVGVWYLLRKHWIANNLFGLAFSLNGVELLHLNNVSTGCILLGGLFIYDVFWVFGTNVMVTVAKSFEAPIKLVFPQDLLEKGLEADNFAMLGLGDIVIPGIFIALLLRFDISLKKNTHTYFYTSFVAYIFGLGLTIFIMHIFKHAQPALLYLVPACIGFPLLVALAKGEVTEMFRWASAGVGAVLPTALEHRKHADVPTPGHSWRDRFIWAGSGCACARLRRRREPGVCSDTPSLAPATSREPSVPYPRGRQRFGSCRALPLLWQARERVGPRTWCRERLGHCVSQCPWVGEDGIGASCGSSRGWFEHIPASPLG
uniref:Histocompatibility minor 13 n=1 Tax=Anas platyrhynchos platyrhynchos TaxID=8840 RepID=A0A493TNF9_ANAPP